MKKVPPGILPKEQVYQISAKSKWAICRLP